MSHKITRAHQREAQAFLSRSPWNIQTSPSARVHHSSYFERVLRGWVEKHNWGWGKILICCTHQLRPELGVCRSITLVNFLLQSFNNQKNRGNSQSHYGFEIHLTWLSEPGSAFASPPSNGGPQVREKHQELGSKSKPAANSDVRKAVNADTHVLAGYEFLLFTQKGQLLNQNKWPNLLINTNNLYVY